MVFSVASDEECVAIIFDGDADADMLTLACVISDANEIPKMIPFDFIIPNYLQNVVVCMVIAYVMAEGGRMVVSAVVVVFIVIVKYKPFTLNR